MCQLGIYNVDLNPGHSLTLVLLFLKNDINSEPKSQDFYG